MTDLPDVRLRGPVNFPVSVTGRTAIAIEKRNGRYYLDLDVSNLVQNPNISAGQVDQSWMLIWNEVDDAYQLVPYALAATSGVASLDGHTGALDIGLGLTFTGDTLETDLAYSIQVIKSREGFLNAGDYGYIPDGNTSSASDNTQAIHDTMAALGSNGGTIRLPIGAGLCDDTILISNKRGITFEGDCSCNGQMDYTKVSSLIYIGDTGPFVHCDGTQAITFKRLLVGNNNTGFSGDLIKLHRTTVDLAETGFTVFDDFCLTGVDGAKGAQLVKASKSIKTFLKHGYIRNGFSGIVGSFNVGEFCNGMTVEDVWFDPYIHYTAVVGGLSWRFTDIISEPPGDTTAAGFFFHSPLGFNGLTIINPQLSDAGIAGQWYNGESATDYGSPGTGNGVSVIGGLLQGGDVSMNVKNVCGLNLLGVTMNLVRADGAILNASLASRVIALGNVMNTSAGPGAGLVFADVPTDAGSYFDNNDGKGPVPASRTRTVSTLPTASTSQGLRYTVTDSSVTTFLSTVAGGGSSVVPVVSDGTNWKVG